MMPLAPRRAAWLALVTIALSVGPALAAPSTLTCTAFGHFNWWSGDPQIFPLGDAESEMGSTLFHVDPASGEWYRQLTGAASLTQDGGTFTIAGSTEWRWHDHWIGVDGASVLRIQGGDAPHRFLMVDADGGVFAGTCIEPDEPFIFLAPRDP